MLGDSAGPGGKYFIYVSDLDRASRYQIGFNDVSLYVLPIDDTSVYNELIDFLYLDKTKMKKIRHRREDRRDRRRRGKI